MTADAALAAPGVALEAGALVGLRALALKTRSEPPLAALPGGFATRRIGQGQEVADLREYQAGDDIRHLDRSTTARTGRLHVRRFQEDRDRVTVLVADLRPPMFWGVSRAFLSVVAAEVLTLIGWHVVEEGGRVGLLALTADAPVALAPRGRARGMLDAIGGLVRAHGAALDAALTGRAGADLDQALTMVDRLCPAGAQVVLASGFDALGPGFEDRLAALDRRRHVALVQITDADRLPAGRYPVRLADGRRLRLALRGQGATEAPPIASRPVLRLAASDPVETLARRLAEGLP